MILLFANDAYTTISGSISNTSLTVRVASGSGDLFPQPVPGTSYFKATFRDTATGLLNEIVHVTDRVGDLLTIVRHQEGTTALNWNAGDSFDNLITAGSLAAMQQAGLFLNGKFVGNFSGSANALICDIGTTLIVGMVIIGQTIAQNTGAATLSTDGGFNYYPVIRGDSAAFTGGELINAQTGAFVFNGTHWAMISELPLSWYESEFDNIYIPINPRVDWYVDITLGTDIPSQGASAGAGAFRTAQYAVNIISRYIGQSGVVLHFADGGYGSITFNSSGIGKWTVVGNSLNPAAVTFSEFTSFGDFRAARVFGTSVEFRFVQFSSSDNNVGASANANVTLTECVFNAPANGVSFCLFILTGGNITVQTAATFLGNGEGFAGVKGGILSLGYSVSGAGHLSFTSIGTPTCAGGFVSVTGLGAIYSDPTFCQFIGNATGNQYVCDGNSVIQINGLVLPGTSTIAPTHGGQVF